MDIYNDSELGDALKLKSLKNKQLWEVPNDYFESFADKFMARLEAEEMNPENTFSDIPSNYFELFLERCKEKLEEENLLLTTPTLANIPKITHFQDIPENYFENLTADISFSLEKEELKERAPILHSIPKKVAYSDIPSDYFEETSKHILRKVQATEKEQTKRKVVSFFSLKYLKTWTSLAAMMIMVMGGGFLFNHLQENKTEKKEVSFAHISNAELAIAANVVDDFDVTTLVEELQLNSETSADLEDFSDEELSNYLKDIDVSNIQ